MTFLKFPFLYLFSLLINGEMLFLFKCTNSPVTKLFVNLVEGVSNWNIFVGVVLSTVFAIVCRTGMCVREWTSPFERQSDKGMSQQGSIAMATRMLLALYHSPIKKSFRIGQLGRTGGTFIGVRGDVCFKQLLPLSGIDKVLWESVPFLSLSFHATNPLNLKANNTNIKHFSSQEHDTLQIYPIPLEYFLYSLINRCVYYSTFTHLLSFN